MLLCRAQLSNQMFGNLGEAMSVETIRAILRNSEGKTYLFAFVDGTEMQVEVVSTTHLNLDDTVVILEVGALANERAWNVALSEIRSVALLSKY